MVNQNLNMGQTATVTISPIDINNNPALLGTNPPVWTGPGGTSGITLATASGAMSALITVSTNAPPGTSTINVQGQNPTAATFTSSFTVTVLPGNATAFNFAIVAH